jgi:hypothetical protein
MRFSSLFYAHAAILAWHKQRVTVLADTTLILHGQTYSCSHSYFSRGFYVTAGQLRICFVHAFGLLEENPYALFSYLLCSGVHFNVSPRAKQYSCREQHRVTTFGS